MMKDIIDTLFRIAAAGQTEPPTSFSLRQMWQIFGTSQPTAGAKLANALAPQAPCPVCVKVQTSENYYVTALRQHLTGPDSLTPAYETSAGLCLPHFRLVLAGITELETLTVLIEAQKGVWQRLSAELGEFIRKKDHRFQHETYGPEGDSWLRAIEAVVGTPPKGKAR